MSRGSHASRLAMSWMAEDDPPRSRDVDGSWVLVDLSGFTRLTERLTDSGAEGVEVLHGALGRCFDALLGGSMELGGDVLGFAGDAALLQFVGDGHLARAMAAAASMSPGLALLPAALTGGRRLRVSVGLHTGAVTAMLVGTSQQRLLFCGPEVSLLARLQGAASAGQVVISASVAALVDAPRVGPEVSPGFMLLPERDGRFRTDRLTSAGADTSPVEGWSERALERSLHLLSPAVREMVDADATTGVVGDHRTVSVGFVMVGGLDGIIAADGPTAAHTTLSTVIDTIVRVGEELAVELIDTDVGVDSIKVLLTAGAPRAVADDEERLLLALRRIVDECAATLPDGVSVRAGGQRGRVFAGRLGVPGRSTYTVIGDPVNVAARALGHARPGQVVAGDGLGVAGRSSVVAESLGELAVRNRVRPVQLWRIDRVVASSSGHTPLPSSSLINLTRSEEWDVVAAAWARVRRGSGEVVVVWGEPGMGVSELVAQAAGLAGAAGTSLDAGGLVRRAPYASIGALVQLLAAQQSGCPKGDSFGGVAQDEAWAWLLQHRELLPDYLQGWSVDAVTVASGHGVAPSGDPQTIALRAHRALAALLVAAAPRPWLLAVDDVDAADESSQAVLDEVTERLSGEAIMVVLGRSSAPPVKVAVVPHQTVELAAIGDAAAEALVLHAAPLLRPDQLTRVLAAGRGNPFVLAELARHPAAGELPDSLQRLGSVLVDALPSTVRQAVRDAAAFGPTVRLGVIASLLRRPELVSPAAWLAARSVVRPSGDHSVAFVHEAYRAAAYESLPFRRRRELHSALADHPELQQSAAVGSRAVHLQLAGRFEEALPLAVEAGLLAKQTGALIEASELLGRAVEMAQRLGDPSLTRLLIELGETRTWLGDADAEGVYRRVAQRAPSDEHRARVSHLMADHLLRRGEYHRAGRWIRRGLAAAEQMGVAGEYWRGMLLLDESWRQSDFGRQTRSVQLGMAALEIAEQLDDVALRGVAYLNLEAAYSVDLDARAIECGTAAIRCFREAGLDRSLGGAYCNVALTSMHLGRWQEAFEWYEQARTLATRSGGALTLANVDLNIGFLLYRQGHHDRAEAIAISALRIFESLGARRWIAFGWVLRGFVAAAQCRFVEAEEWGKKARALFVELNDIAMVLDCDVGYLDRLLAVGRVEEVLASASSLERRLAVAEVEVGVMIEFDRVVGQARMLLGDRAGLEQIRRAVRRSRSKRMPYDEYLCLRALLALADELPPREVARVRQAHHAIVAKLGIVTSELPAPPA